VWGDRQSDRDGSGAPCGPSRIVAFKPFDLRRFVTVPARDLGPILAAVTNAVVMLHRTHYGKGPTRSKSYLFDGIAICVMNDVFTTVERTLIDAGEGSRVRSTRLAFQDAMEDEIKQAVGAALGRTVIAVTSQVLTSPEVAIYVFVLEPES
jgi:uncharacterized protein YbcI